MEVAKFVFSALGSFVGVMGLSFTILNMWMKKRQEEIAAERKLNEDARKTLNSRIDNERLERKEDVGRIEERLDKLDNIISRLANIEGELGAMQRSLRMIEQWFITNTPGVK
jgi:hypothetical protein